MATNSVIANLPRPELTDIPNAPTAFNDLTDALDLITIPRFSSASARDLVITAPTDGQHAYLTDSHTLTRYNSGVAAWITYSTTGTSSIVSSKSTDTFSFTNTTPATGTQVVSTVFTAPPSGSVWVNLTARIFCSTDTNLAAIGWELRTGSVVGSGTIVLANDINTRAIVAGRAVNSGAAAHAGATLRQLVTGLTPASSYYFRARHWVDPAGTGNILYRELVAEPI